MVGTVAILNVSAGDTKLTFDPKMPAEVARAAKVVKDMLRRGFALLVEVGHDDKGPLYRRVHDFDADTELAEITDDIDRDSIAHAVEEAGGFILSDAEIARWRTVGDVEASLRAVLAQAGSAAA